MLFHVELFRVSVYVSVYGFGYEGIERTMRHLSISISFHSVKWSEQKLKYVLLRLTHTHTDGHIRTDNGQLVLRDTELSFLKSSITFFSFQNRNQISCVFELEIFALHGRQFHSFVFLVQTNSIWRRVNKIKKFNK